MNRILITGGSGFLGRHLVTELLNRYKDIEIRTVSRGETEIARMLAESHNDRLEPIIGDIRDVDTLRYALKEIDTVIHLAAMKHVDLCELCPSEAITTNIIGTMNLLMLFSGNTFIAMSTDKAAEPSNCYGATKLLLERLILEQARKNTDRRYMAVRSGNLFGSSGSVVEKWKQQIRQSNRITVTNLEMTRFFVKVDTLVDFIIEVIEQGENGKIYVPFQKAATLKDVAKAVTEVYGDGKTTMEFIGLREGERMHERICLSPKEVASQIDECSSEYAERLSIEEMKGWLIS